MKRVIRAMSAMEWYILYSIAKSDESPRSHPHKSDTFLTNGKTFTVLTIKDHVETAACAAIESKRHNYPIL
ncbi:MAG: hypothetical protein JST19_22470 [Bacteroidetes bacterium]|nr:hypothetical protein [Bacteroidota bacterium]